MSNSVLLEKISCYSTGQKVLAFFVAQIAYRIHKIPLLYLYWATGIQWTKAHTNVKFYFNIILHLYEKKGKIIIFLYITDKNINGTELNCSKV
jgi:hypothetical protein